MAAESGMVSRQNQEWGVLSGSHIVITPLTPGVKSYLSVLAHTVLLTRSMDYLVIWTIFASFYVVDRGCCQNVDPQYSLLYQQQETQRMGLHFLIE